jgi:hypothetical protein
VGRSVVKTDIPWGGVLAYTRGQTLDSDLVEQHGWQDYVVGENTKEGREIKTAPARAAVDPTEKKG